MGVYASPEGERPYGERKAVEAQAAAGPTQGGGHPQQQAAGGGGGADPRLAAALQEGVFGPTRRPGEAPTAGMPFGPGPGPQQPALPEDPDMLLRALVQAYPHPDLVRLLNRG